MFEYFELLPDFFRKDKETTQYKVFNNLLKYMKYQQKSQESYKSILYGVFPFFETDLYLKLSQLPSGKTYEFVQNTDNVEREIYNQQLLPNSVYCVSTHTHKKIKMLDFQSLPLQLQDTIFNQLSQTQTNVTDKVIEGLVLNEFINAQQNIGNIIYYVTNTKFGIYDTIGQELLLELSENFSNQTRIVVVPNGFIVKIGNIYKPYLFVYDYYFLLNDKVYTTNTLLDTTEINKIYCLNDYYNIQKGLNRVKTDTLSWCMINYIYNIIMKSDKQRLSQLEISTDTDLGVNNKLRIFEQFIVAHIY